MGFSFFQPHRQMGRAEKRGQVLRHQVFAQKYERLFMVGDGSCLFHSIATLLDLDSCTTKPWKQRVKAGHKLRRAVVGDGDLYESWLRERGFFGVPGILSVAEAKDPYVWADDTLINFTSWRLGLSLYLVKNSRQTFVRRADGEWACLLAHIDQSHFEPIVPVAAAAVPSTYALPPNIDMVVGDAACVYSTGDPVLQRLRVIG